jgi:hypothetical protein
MSAFKRASTSKTKREQMARDAERARARRRLEKLKEEKISLQRDVFFVPGWSDEKARCWSKCYRNGYTIMEDQIKLVTKNPEKAHFITFSEDESKKCESFLDFAKVLKKRIDNEVGLNTPIDLVGHSMGGLDIIAAITQGPNPLSNVKRCITVATPHRGSDLGEFQYILRKLRKQKPHWAIQIS